MSGLYFKNDLETKEFACSVVVDIIFVNRVKRFVCFCE